MALVSLLAREYIINNWWIVQFNVGSTQVFRHLYGFQSKFHFKMFIELINSRGYQEKTGRYA